jgi:hypothetical protein
MTIEAKIIAERDQVSARKLEVLAEEHMLGPFFKDFADKGHWFNTAHGECIRCGVPVISLSEDQWYEDIRSCTRALMEKPHDGLAKGNEGLCAARRASF